MIWKKLWIEIIKMIIPNKVSNDIEDDIVKKT